jgi:hypothetical protein
MNTFACTECGSQNLATPSDEVFMVCGDCGVFTTYTAGPTLDELRLNVSIHQTSSLEYRRTYKRKTHLLSILYQLSGLSKTDIPSAVGELVMNTNNWADIERQLTEKKLFGYVRNARNLYNEKNKLDQAYNRDVFTTCVRLFSEIDRIWTRIQPRVAPTRKSFLSYAYVLDKICERMGWDRIRKDLKPIKCAKIKETLDRYWKEIVCRINWKCFIGPRYASPPMAVSTVVPVCTGRHNPTLRSHVWSEALKVQYRSNSAVSSSVPNKEPSLPVQANAANPSRDPFRAVKCFAKKRKICCNDLDLQAP